MTTSVDVLAVIKTMAHGKPHLPERGWRRVKGRATCATVYDQRGRAHLVHPGVPIKAGVITTVCDRRLEMTGEPSAKSCGACAEGAPAANLLLRIKVR